MTLGALDFEHASVSVDTTPGLRLVAYTPLPGESASGVQELARR
jgi:hypothetical protein